MADILDFCNGQPVGHFESGETIIPEGARLGKLFVLIEGQIEVIRKDTQVSYVDEPGSIFGEMSVLLDMPHSATVKALSEVDAYVIDDALRFLESRSEVAIHLATLLARRLYYTTTYLVDLQQQNEGRRRDLDVVDQILGSLVHGEDETAAAPAPAKPPRKRSPTKKQAE
ncbi:MAG: cyclic nucleotide-binding domain-containing protein [Devosia sp.]|nr:cyclic nucleotide-binding domain-containing protein [Devosia sp.]